MGTATGDGKLPPRDRRSLCQPHRPRNPAAADRGGLVAPPARDSRAAAGALAVDQLVRRHAEAGAADEELVAARAVRPLAVADRAGDVAGIDEAQAGAAADGVRAQQRRRRRVAVAGHLVVLVKGGDVPRDVAVDAGEELGDLRQLVVAVVELRDDERSSEE